MSGVGILLWLLSPAREEEVVVGAERPRIWGAEDESAESVERERFAWR